MVPAKNENPVSDFKFDALTSLRGIAALCTVLAHLIVIWGDVFPALQQGSLFRDFALHTYLFVDFFFVLSGFVMSHAYGRHFADAVRPGSYMRFLRARFARVYPLLVQKAHITKNPTILDLIVAKEPMKAGIDPYNKLIDRTPEDNVTSVVRRN